MESPAGIAGGAAAPSSSSGDAGPFGNGRRRREDTGPVPRLQDGTGAAPRFQPHHLAGGPAPQRQGPPYPQPQPPVRGGHPEQHEPGGGWGDTGGFAVPGAVRDTGGGRYGDWVGARPVQRAQPSPQPVQRPNPQPHQHPQPHAQQPPYAHPRPSPPAGPGGGARVPGSRRSSRTQAHDPYRAVTDWDGAEALHRDLGDSPDSDQGHESDLGHDSGRDRRDSGRGRGDGDRDLHRDSDRDHRDSDRDHYRDSDRPPDPDSDPDSDSVGTARRARRRRARTVTGISAAAVTAVLAVVVAGQQSGAGAKDSAATASGADGRKLADSTSRDEDRTTPQGSEGDRAADALPSYDQRMAQPLTMAADQGGPNTFDIVPGADKAPGKGKKFRYRVDVEKNIGLDGKFFAEAVQKTLNDKRSWAGDDAMAFERISSGNPDFVVTLATPRTTDIWCEKSGLDTSAEHVSCDSAATERVMINAFRWAGGSPTFGPKLLLPYRQMLINHEVGHRLGHDHQNCAEGGALAPVMMQQTKTLRTGDKVCRPNAWVHPGS